MRNLQTLQTLVVDILSDLRSEIYRSDRSTRLEDSGDSGRDWTDKTAKSIKRQLCKNNKTHTAPTASVLPFRLVKVKSRRLHLLLSDRETHNCYII